MKSLRPKLTYANAVATLALFIAVGGASAFAASQLSKNSVGPKQLKRNAVTTAKIKDQAVTAAKIQNGALTGAQINASTLGTVPNASHATSADNADTLDGRDSGAYVQEVASGSFTWDPPSLASEECDEEVIVRDDLQPTDVVVFTVRNIGSYQLNFQVAAVTSGPTISFYGCNELASTVDLSAFELHWRLLR
jgi:hypothetical protein